MYIWSWCGGILLTWMCWCWITAMMMKVCLESIYIMQESKMQQNTISFWPNTLTWLRNTLLVVRYLKRKALNSPVLKTIALLPTCISCIQPLSQNPTKKIICWLQQEAELKLVEEEDESCKRPVVDLVHKTEFRGCGYYSCVWTGDCNYWWFQALHGASKTVDNEDQEAIFHLHFVPR